MLVYITMSSKTELAPAAIRGLSLWHLSVGGGFLARRRAAKYLRRLYEAGVRRGVFDTAALAALAARQGIDPVPVLPLRLSLLDGLLDALCGDTLSRAAVCLRCGAGGEEAAHRAADVLARRARYIRIFVLYSTILFPQMAELL